LDELDFVTVWSIDERNHRSIRTAMRAITEWITERGGVFGEGSEIFYLKSEVCEIRADQYGAAGIVFADFDQLLAAWGLEKNQLGTPSALAASNFFEAEDISVKGDSFIEIAHAVAGVE
jgi:hypothetical protein